MSDRQLRAFDSAEEPVEEQHGRFVDELRWRFSRHAPNGEQAVMYDAIREYAYRFALFIRQGAPVSREQSLALTRLEEVVFWANAAIARHGGGE